jgi:twitching motility protein PilT
MEKIIKAAVDRGASDLHIKAGDVFRARIDGRLVPLTKQRLTPEQTRAIAARLIPNEEDRAQLDVIRDYDCSWGMPGVGRFRVNVLRQRSSFMIVMRVVPFDVPSFESLDLPSALTQIAGAQQGLILVTGVSGSGKSSTVAAIVNHINQTQHKHILTLESPIEFLHRDINSSVTQREVGVDTPDYRVGLQAALRQDPDVIVIGELRDAETIGTALKAAETGKLVLSTLATPDVPTTVTRLVATFPAEEQDMARLRLSETLQAIITQRLLQRADGQGRIAALEILVAIGDIREALRDPARTGELHELLRAHRDEHGTQTFDQHLADLVIESVITHKTGVAAASNAEDFEEHLRVLRKPARGKGRKRGRGAKEDEGEEDEETADEEEGEGEA